MRAIVVSLLLSTTAFAQSYPGSFSRIGLNAKGMALGNSVSAMPVGNVYTYYNPALASFQPGGNVSGSIALMSLDRQLNVITYTQGLKSGAGFSIGLINGSVSNIDGRNSDGLHTSDLSTNEYLTYFSFANQFVPGLSLGLSLKVYYYNLYSGISSTAIGFDFGGLYKVTPFLSVGVTATDIDAQYRWNSASLYGQDGSSFATRFPNIFKFGASYDLPALSTCVSAEYDAGPSSLGGFRGGIEYAPLQILVIRAGIAASNQLNLGTVVTPSFGFGAKVGFLDFTPEINYAYVLEPFTPYGIQTISLDFGF